MRVEEALALLQIDEVESRKSLKRAYLRAVRRHPPETDPDGFQKVRVAFELLESFAEDGRNPSPPTLAVPAQAPVSPSGMDARRSASSPQRDARPARPTAADLLGRLVAAYEAGGEVETSVDIARELIEALRLEARPQEYVFELLEFVLALEQEEKSREARELFKSIQSLVSEARVGAFLPSDTVAMMLLLRELAELRDTFDSEIRAAIASGLAARDSAASEPRLVAIARDRPEIAKYDLLQLKLRAPKLHAMFSEPLSPLIYGAATLPLALACPLYALILARYDFALKHVIEFRLLFIKVALELCLLSAAGFAFQRFRWGRLGSVFIPLVVLVCPVAVVDGWADLSLGGLAAARGAIQMLVWSVAMLLLIIHWWGLSSQVWNARSEQESYE